jgi:hypothetical protein
MKFFLLILILLASCSTSKNIYSQGFHTTSNKAVNTYLEGVSFYDFLDLPNAEHQFREALKIDSKFFEAYMMLGELYTRQKKYGDAAENYKKALSIDSTAYKPMYFNMATAEFMTGNYSDALIHYRSYLRNKGISEKNRPIANRNIRNSLFAIEAMKKPVPFNPVSVGQGINSAADEYWPSITADGQTFMFTRQERASSNPALAGTYQEDFYISFLSDDGWKKAVNAGGPLNTGGNEGAQTLSSSGNYMYFAACEKSGGLGSCDIYFSALNDGHWSQPYNIGAPVNSSAWESTPSVSADGNMLFFSSSRPGGIGGKDLWLAYQHPNGMWYAPTNLGPAINTSGDEMSPFIHFDGRTLYFASDGRPGMGGFDIYMSRMNDDSTWTEPRNIGYPINTCNDEMGLIIDATGQKAYFSSMRNNAGGKDIYLFDLDESVRPDPVSYLKGKVADKETGKLIKAEYELINLSSNKVTIKNSTDDQGNFLVCLPSGYNYGINVSKTGYLFYSENFMFEGQHSVVEPFIKRINLSPAKVGEKMLLSNVFYEVDSWELKKESILELNNLVDLLKYNKDLVVEIGGYTDSTGTDEYNLVLSGKRALSVVNYLITKGILSERLKYKGYGNTSPIGDNITTEGRKLNRRTEVKIIASQK